MSDLIIEGAQGIPDGLYVIKDGELFKYKPNGGTVRPYHITDRPKGEWIEMIDCDPITGEPYPCGVRCSNCGDTLGCVANFCPNCGSDMRGKENE